MAELVFHPIYSRLTLPDKHRFPIDKYQGIRNVLAKSGVINDAFHLPDPVEEALLKQEFNPGYIENLLRGQLDRQAMRRIGFPWSEQLVRRTLTAVGGTLLTTRLALETGMALNLTGGYHHAFADFGSGFCMVNDLYLAARQALHHPDVDRVLIFDCDVHQGDGTALLAQGMQDIITVSLHGEKNFPHRKQVSDMDFALPKGTRDQDYLDVLDSALHMAIQHYRPDFVLYDAGVDIHQDDDLGHLLISTEGIFLRDAMVLGECRKRGIPVAAVIGGGYQRDTSALVDVHLQLFRAAGVV